ncbi:hypothetical protein ACN6Q0_17825, partial [Acinetobacter baumannii]
MAAYALKLQLDSERVFNEINALKGLDKGSIKIACSTGFSLVLMYILSLIHISEPTRPSEESGVG